MTFLGIFFGPNFTQKDEYSDASLSFINQDRFAQKQEAADLKNTGMKLYFYIKNLQKMSRSPDKIRK